MPTGGRYLGTHIVADFYNCSTDLFDSNKIKQIAIDAAEYANMTIEGVIDKFFEPYGLTVLVLLAESHLAIHTYPEHGYCAVDIFTCGDNSLPYKAFKYLEDELNPSDVYFKNLVRGLVGDTNE